MEEFCKWCGDGGELICCDFCEKVFCQKCVKRNMGSEFLKILLDADEEKWKCFSCDPTQIENFTDECRVIMKILKRMKMKGYAFENKKTHLGGPSQFERKERLINIRHTLEEKGFTSNEIIKIEIDPDINISAVEAKSRHQAQSPKGKKASKCQKSKGKPKDKHDSEDSRKGTVLNNDNLEDMRSPDVVRSPCEVEIRGVDRSLASTNNRVSSNDKNTENHGEIDKNSDEEERTCSDQILSPKEINDLKAKYSVKGLKVVLERIKIPENCILPSTRDAELENADFGSDCREDFDSFDASKEDVGSRKHSKNRRVDKGSDEIVQIVLLSDSEEENETTKDNIVVSTANDVKTSNLTDKKKGSSKTAVPDGIVIDDSTGSGNGKVVKKGKNSKDFLRCAKQNADDQVNEDNIYNDSNSQKTSKKQSRKSLKTKRRLDKDVKKSNGSIESDHESRSGSLIDVDDLDYDSDESEFKPSDDSEDDSGDNSDSGDNGDSGDNDDTEMFEDEGIDAAVASDVKLEDSFENVSGNNRQDSSDSEYDYQRLASRSIRHRGKMKEVGGKERVGTKKQANSAKDEESDEELKSESSDDSLPQKSPRKRKRKGNPRKKHVSSESDSDFATRTKKRPRRRKLSEHSSRSESEESDSNGHEEEEDRKGKGKRRSKKKRKGAGRKGKGKRRKTRSKVINSDSEGSSDDDDDDDDDKSPSKNKGRKNIRRLLAEEELTEETRKARQLEEERRQRLLERTQKTYEEEQCPQKLDMTGRIVLEMDKKSGKPLVEVHKSLRPHLKPHQVEGIQFMYDCLFESLEKFEAGDKGNGALLAHCMGLGKTLQVLFISAKEHFTHSKKYTRFLTTKGFLRIFYGFLLKNRFSQRCTRSFGSEMPLDFNSIVH